MFFIMKKFVGNVNGKNFDNEKEFNEAAKKAMKDGGSNLDISYYYEQVDDEKKVEDEGKDKVEDKKDENFVHTHEYFLGSRNPDVVNEDGSVKFNVPDELLKRINTSINRDSIKKKLEYHLGSLGDMISRDCNKVESMQMDIASLTNKLNNFKQGVKDTQQEINILKGKYNYYHDIITYIQEIEEKEIAEQESKERPVRDDKDFRSSLLDMSALDFLKQLGFIK